MLHITSQLLPLMLVLGLRGFGLFCFSPAGSQSSEVDFCPFLAEEKRILLVVLILDHVFALLLLIKGCVLQGPTCLTAVKGQKV